MDLETPAEQVKHTQRPNQPVQKQGMPASQLVDAILTQNVVARVRVTHGGAPATTTPRVSVPSGKHVESCSNRAAAVVEVTFPRAL